MSDTAPAQDRVLVINSGSSSLKFQLLAPGDGTVDASGIVERIGLDHGAARISADEKESHFTGAVPDHVEAMRIVENLFADVGISLTDGRISAVGHRVVQGGALFDSPTLVTDEVRDSIHDLGRLAPLHNYAAVDGINGARTLLPNVPHVAVFDTAFFAQLPAEAYTYAVPRDFAERYDIRRYGAHGTSHRYVSETVSAYLAEQGTDVSDLKQIVLHLGNGASASAVRAGRPLDTSMGLTPLEGLVMGTRSGDIDPSVYVHLNRQAGLSPAEVDTMLNKRSGMQGLCGMSDFRDIAAAIEDGDEVAKTAMDVYAHRLRKYIGSYAFVLGGLDVITFTAGIGENAAEVREAALEGLEAFGIELDVEKNRVRAKGIRDLSAPGSRVKILVVPTDEELAIARQADEVARAL